MLVLSRRLDESVIIGEDIIVTVMDISGGKVRLGFSAPPDVRVDRSEARAAFEAKRAEGGGR